MAYQIVSKVIEWYSDICIISTALIICILLSIITVRSICCGSKPLRNTLTLQVCVVFVSIILYLFINLLRVISLTIIGDTKSQQRICNIENSISLILFGTYNLAIDIFLINRLKTVFKHSPFELSDCMHYAYIIALSIFWCMWMINTAFMIITNDAKPYNIYTESIDTNGHATTCLVTAAHNTSQGLKLVLFLAMMGLFFGNLIVWILFTRKLYFLLKLQSGILDGMRKTKSKYMTLDDSEFIELMKRQTMLVGIMIFVTVCTFSLTIVIQFGQLLVTINSINQLFTIFLSFRFNKYYFELFKCNKCSQFCCQWFENIIMNKITLTLDSSTANSTIPTEPTLNMHVQVNSNSTVVSAGQTPIQIPV
eukprot:175623_1